ncbi:hypothetical protein DL767_000926 [Monosporascus sp. MG133]|nr:hypothetical protein DL767_000926 [Monosporascus sp. MG133]
MRHERTRKAICVDLLRRHARISHNAGLDMAESQAEVLPIPAVHDTTEIGVDNPEFLDFDLMAQDMLPTNPFDAFVANFPTIHPPSTNSLPRIHSICRFSSRLPPVLDDEINLADEDRSEGTPGTKAPPWSITERDYDRLRLATQEFSAALPLECSLPSQDMLMGQLEAYLRCTRGFLSFIHTPTFSAGEKDVELLLAMAAVGSLYRIRRTKAYESYFIAKAILSEKVRCDGLKGLNLLTVVFDIPALILNHEVRVCLPSCAEPWKAENAAQWGAIPRQVEREFGGALRSLFDGMMFPRESGVSSSANYVLIHGVLQQLWAARLGSTGPLSPDCTKAFERALRTWQLSWELTPESTLDPLSPKGWVELFSSEIFNACGASI